MAKVLSQLRKSFLTESTADPWLKLESRSETKRCRREEKETQVLLPSPRDRAGLKHIFEMCSLMPLPVPLFSQGGSLHQMPRALPIHLPRVPMPEAQTMLKNYLPSLLSKKSKQI